MSRVALITGASRGLGRSLAVELVKRDYHLVLLARTVGGLEETDDLVKAAGGTATLVPLDLYKADQEYNHLAASLHERFGKLNLLIGNAAMLGTLGPLPLAEMNATQHIMQVNTLANYRLIRAVDPLLRAAKGTAVFMDCGLGHDTKAYWGLYHASKAALRAYVESYAAEVQSFGVKAFMHNPGLMGTALYGQAFPGIDLKTVPTAQDAAAALVSELAV